MRRAAEAVVEALFVVDREAGGLLVMEGAAGFIFAAGAGDLHRAADEGRQRDARAEFVQPLRGEGHSSSLPLPSETLSPFVSSPSTALQALRINFRHSPEVETPIGVETRSEEHTSDLQSLMRN